MYAPSADGRHKVYIVDEAHMLTREAWNALLKILEEPPPRVIFVFATTEPNKIQQSAAPILSRCQRFDFRRIGVADIEERLTEVLTREGMTAAPEALRLVARKADGGMRDALSLMDQVLSLTGGEIDTDSVRRVLGLVEDERYIELLDVLREGRHADVFGLVERLVDEGYDLVEFHHGLLDVLRILLRLRLQPDASVDVRDDIRVALLERSVDFDAADLVRMLASAADLESQGSLRRNPNPRLPIEMLLLRMSFLDRTVHFEELIRALGGAAPPEGGRDGGEGMRPRSQVATKPADAPPAPKATPAPPAPPVAPKSAQDAWQAWLNDGKAVPKGLGAFLRTARVVELDDGRISVGGLAAPAEERLGEGVVLEAIREGFAPYLGRPVRLVVESSAATPSVTRRVTEKEVRDDTLRALYRQEPRLKRAVEELDLELME
jgi:DNA polymerase-3 subunit gamma/tau